MSRKPEENVNQRPPEVSKVPGKVKAVVGVGALLGLVFLLLFCASALAGYGTWGKSILWGVGQFAFYFFLAMSVQQRRRWAWWLLLFLTLINTLMAVEHLLRLFQVTMAGRLGSNLRENLFDGIGLLQVLAGVVLLCLLLSRQVRSHVQRRA